MSRIYPYLLALALALVATLAVVSASDAKTNVPAGATIARDQLPVSHVKPLSEIPYRFLAKVADKAIREGHVYSHRWGDASPWLKAICYEMIDRAFSPYGTQGWARYVVNRESGCNPAAINSTSGANGIAQIMPSVHTGYDHDRIRNDMAYAMRTFLRLSRNGSNTGPWCLC